ncbi:tripartite tricarboxylate transporter permease, partial [Roseovarius sp.]|uniref:tripartite tricarboxylate transporter permease n=1 Tax=Roseovarius sp. TaxID=1486281 RepID=UPI00356A11C2
QHGEALGTGLIASAIGTLCGYLILLFIVSPVAILVLMLGPTEMLAVAIWGLLLIAVLNDSSVAKGVAAGLLGILISTIGYSNTGLMRGTFGSMYLLDGIPAIPALIGLFAASELINMAGRGDYLVADRNLRKMRLMPILKGALYAVRAWPQVLRGSAIGTGIGIIPGVGASVANLASYAAAKRLSSRSEDFGTGNPDGVIASEGANSSSEGGGMVTLLALGLPGGAGTAILLGAFAMHNVTGGPRFISENTDIVYALILGNIVQAFLLIVVGLIFVFLASSIVKVRLSYLIPFVLAISMMGAFAITGSMVGPVTVAGAGALGWVMRRYGYPVVATVVGLLIGPMAEGELTRSWQISGGDPAFLLERPMTIAMLLMLALTVTVVLMGRRKARSHPALAG